MLKESEQRDTLLNKLNQAVEPKSTNTLNVTRKLIHPATVKTVDSINIADRLSNSSKVNQQVITKPAQHTESIQLLDSVTPIRSRKVELQAGTIEKPGIVLPEKPLPNHKPDWFIGVFIIALILLATVRLFFNKYLNQLFHAVVNYATSSRLFRERTFSLTHASFRLDLIFYFVFSVFIYQLFDEFNISFGQPSFITYLIILGMVVGYFILKRLAYFFTGTVSESVPETAEFFFNVNIHARVLGLFLIPITLIIAFSSLQNPDIVSITGLAICGIFYLLLLIRGAKILMTKHFSIFYLILYLCTLEILPLIFIYKLVLVKNGIS
ncbi:MAG TPA: DUF4271 domain-containing protein [Sunxiuqinia sp.]|nr:DUF4271 domain-containing protein [Sunxiuqinia sp.]